MPLQYEDYAGRVKPANKLDQLIDQMNNPGVDKHLTKIASVLDHLDELTAELELKSQILGDLERKYTNDRQRQRCGLLRAWKSEHGVRATYKVLLTACVETCNSDAAEMIVRLLNYSSSMLRGRTKSFIGDVYEGIDMQETESVSDSTRLSYDLPDLDIQTVTNDFSAEKPNMLSIHKGQKILILHKSEDWYMAANLESKVGWIPFAHVSEDSSLETHSWFHKNMTRDNAEKKLEQLAAKGSFLVRESESRPGEYTLSVYNRNVSHYMIEEEYRVETSSFQYSVKRKSVFDSIPDLIAHYSNSHGLSTALRNPVPNIWGCIKDKFDLEKLLKDLPIPAGLVSKNGNASATEPDKTNVLNKLRKQQLTCSICLGIYRKPKQLQCQHAYCQECLEELVKKDQQQQPFLTCPTCRKATPLPSGVSGLQSDFRINQLIDLVGDDSKDVKFETDDTDHTSHEDFKCRDHRSKPLDFYCEKCEVAICSQCFKDGGAHFGHNWNDLSDAFISREKQIESSLNLATQLMARLDTEYSKVCSQQVTLEAEIHDSVIQLREDLNNRETELISDLDQLTKHKLKCLNAQKEEIGTIRDQLDSYLSSLKEATKAKCEGMSVLLKINEVHYLMTTLKQDNSDLKAEADAIFSIPEKLPVKNYGQISAGLPDPERCFISGMQEIAEVKKESVATLQILNSNDQPCTVSIESLACELVSELTSVKEKGHVEKKHQNQYHISYQPTVRGRHKLHIKVKGQHISGSPFITTAKSLGQELLGTPIQTIDGINKPMGIALSNSGEIVVTEGEEHSVSIFSPSGEKILSFGKQGSSNGEFNYPHGVTVDLEGNLVITDFRNHRLQKFTQQGEFLSKLGERESSQLQFTSPVNSIALNASNGRIYVADIDGRIQILNSDYSFYKNFGKKGRKDGQFNSPQSIAFDSLSNVYVVDRYNNRIQVFTSEGEFLKIFGDIELEEPIGMVIDSDRVFVSEFANHRISVFTLEGKFKTSFGSNGKGPGQFEGPRGLAMDSSGILYVCDGGNNRVQLF